MSVTVAIPGALRPLTGGRARVALEGSPATVAQALDALCQAYPGVRDRILTEQGEVRPHVNVFVGVQSIRHTGGLQTAVPDGAEIAIIAAVSGGSGVPRPCELYSQV
ncbi:MAG TPA: ubiquitin-like small modifier protein 1 [Vicinamibacteria bacterium]